MPGKSSLSSDKRQTSASKNDRNNEEGGKKILIWPEWTDAELNAEKWDTSGKGKDKGKGGAASGPMYEDPDQPRLPTSLTDCNYEWKRPSEYLQEKNMADKSPVMVAGDTTNLSLDLMSKNKHLFKSKLMCKIIAELQLLWKLRGIFPPFVPTDYDQAAPECWLPWQHIQPWPKGNLTPIYNLQGKYCVRIHWMGEWRKITVDDQLPLDSSGQLLLPVTVCEGELWPAIITKAVLKILNLEGKESCDMSVIQALTGWFGEEQSLSSECNDSWDKLKPLLQKWVREPNEQGISEEERAVEAGEDEREDKGCRAIVVGFFVPLSEEGKAKDRGACAALSEHPHPVLMSKWRDEPLELPPLEPPLPTLESPYYLGLTNRKPRPGYPPPPPPKTDFRSFEIYSPLSSDILNNTCDSPVNACLSDSWIDLDEFQETFSIIAVYRNPKPFNRIIYNDLSMTTPNSVAPPVGLKKGVSITQILPVKGSGNLLVVDHNESESVQVFLSFSCISSWYEGSEVLGLEPVPSLGMKKALEPIDTNCGDNQKEELVNEENKGPEPPHLENPVDSGTPTPLSKEQVQSTLVPGSLVVQRYTWHFPDGTVHNGGEESERKLPMIQTFGSKTVSVDLPKGRHVLKLEMSAPFGYLIDVYSLTTFKMSSEEEVWSELGKPSPCYFSQGEKVFEVLADISAEGSGPSNQLPEIIKGLQQGEVFTKSHIKALRVSLLRVLHVLGKKIDLGSSQMFTLKRRILKVMESISDLTPKDRVEAGPMDTAEMRKLEFKLGDEVVKPEEQDKGKGEESGRQSKLKKQKRIDDNDGDEGKSSSEIVTEKAEEEEEDDENDEDLRTAVTMILEHKKDMGVATFECLYALRPDILEVISLGTSEHTRVHYNKYEGAVPQLEPRGWSLLFRSSFTVPCDQTIALRLSAGNQPCIVKLIDNDTGAVAATDLAPKLVRGNNKGYTLLGEVWSYGEAVEGGTNWSLVLLSSSYFLPIPKGIEEGLITTFHTVDTRKYYLPDRDYRMLRYIITVSDSCHVTLQLGTSKRNACFKLEVIDGDSAIIQQEGCGHCVIPSLVLLPEEEKQDGEEIPLKKSHKYIVQATVLYDSWTVDESAWPYLSMIKSMQKEGTQSNKPPSGKKGKGKGGGTRTPKPSLTAAIQFRDGVDTSKPHWTLRIVTGIKNSQAITVEEDKSKEEELKMMQQVWEQSQPGRAKKAQQSRQKFLESHALNKEEGLSDEVTSDAGTSSSTAGESGIPNFGPVPLKPMDLTQYILSPDESPPKIFDQELENERLASRQKIVREYREWRKEVKLNREVEAEQRDYTKLRQIELAESWQLQLEECRNKLNEPRETMREKYLAKHRAKTPTEETPIVQPAPTGKDAKSKTAKGKKK